MMTFWLAALHPVTEHLQLQKILCAAVPSNYVLLLNFNTQYVLRKGCFNGLISSAAGSSSDNDGSLCKGWI